VPIDSQHRFELDFARKVHHVANETEPIVFIYTRSLAIYESRLAAFISARNCWNSHWLLPFFLFFSCCPWINWMGVGKAAGVPLPLLKPEKNY
jgi:hypothetical protein